MGILPVAALARSRCAIFCLLTMSHVALAEQTIQVDNQRKYHFGLGVAKPIEIGNEFNHYEKLFGGPGLFPQIWIERYFFKFGLDLGVRWSAAYYQDKGNGAKNLNPSDFPLKKDLTDEQVDKTQTSRLSLIPVQLSLVTSYSPFSKRWVIFQAWFGQQWTLVQNTLTPAVSDGESDVSFINEGWNRESVFGAAISFDLSWADSRSTYSWNAYGISGLFLTPFIEVQQGASKGSLGVYDRKSLGLMFTLESLK